MKSALFAAVAVLLSTSAIAEPVIPPFSPMEGKWTVDLRPSLDAAPYSQPMEISVKADKSVTGSFYNSEILAGKAVVARGRSCIAFRTTDGSGFYHSSACLIDGKMIGTTWAEGRGFLFPWTAER